MRAPECDRMHTSTEELGVLNMAKGWFRETAARLRAEGKTFAAARAAGEFTPGAVRLYQAVERLRASEGKGPRKRRSR